MVFFSPVAFSIAVRNSASVVIPLFSAHAVGTSVNIIVSDNNIAKIRCFITFIFYISFYLIRFRGFKQKNRRFQDMVLPMPESAFALYSVDSVKQRTPLALSWPILFSEIAGASCASEPLEGSARSCGTRGNGGGPPLAAGWPGGPRSFASPACAGFAHKFYIKKAADCAFPVNRRFL